MSAETGPISPERLRQLLLALGLDVPLSTLLTQAQIREALREELELAYGPSLVDLYAGQKDLNGAFNTFQHTTNEAYQGVEIDANTLFTWAANIGGTPTVLKYTPPTNRCIMLYSKALCNYATMRCVYPTVANLPLNDYGVTHGLELSRGTRSGVAAFRLRRIPPEPAHPAGIEFTAWVNDLSGGTALPTILDITANLPADYDSVFHVYSVEVHDVCVDFWIDGVRVQRVYVARETAMPLMHLHLETSFPFPVGNVAGQALFTITMSGGMTNLEPVYFPLSENNTILAVDNVAGLTVALDCGGRSNLEIYYSLGGAGVVYVEGSRDNATWRITDTINLAVAGTGTKGYSNAYRYVRVRSPTAAIAITLEISASR